MAYLTENSLYVEGVDSAVVDASLPVDGVSTGLEKSPGQTGFFVHCQSPYALWLRDAASGTWSQTQLFDALTLMESTTYEWGNADSLYVQSLSADQKVYIYPRTGPLYIDGDTSDNTNAHDTVVVSGNSTAVNVSPSSVDISAKSINDLDTKLYTRPVTAPGGYDDPVQDSVMFYDEDVTDGNHWKYRTGKSLVKDAVDIDNNSDGKFLKWDNASDSFAWETPLSSVSPTVDGSLAVLSTDASETAFRVSTSTDNNFFVIDESSDHDNRARVMIQTTNDFDASDVPYLGLQRGLVHIEREADDAQCALSIWSHGGTHSDNSGINVVSWASAEGAGSYINLLSNDGVFPTGHVPDTKTLGKISFGGYTNNQHRTSAHIQAKATENWHYGNRLGSKVVISTTPVNTSVAADHLSVSSAGVVLHAPSTAIDSAEMGNSSVCMSLDETSHKLTITVKYSDGTVKTGLVDLV